MSDSLWHYSFYYPDYPCDYSSSSDSDPSEDSLPIAPSSEFPLAPVVAPPGIRRRPAILRVGPFPARRLAWRREPYRSLDRHSLPDFTSDSSSSSSSSDSSSDISLGSSSDSTSVHSSEVYTKVCTIVYSLPTYDIRVIPRSSSERSLDSSSPSARLSRKRCRSPTTLVLDDIK
ncbi:hypothetical protein Tco_1099105 [Tanacetum coccineum]